MTVRLYRGDAALAAPDPAHRGIAYGDGLFETMRVHDGAVHWWSRHWRRLAEGAGRLHIGLPDEGFVRAQVAELLAAATAGQHGGAVLKLVLSRSPGTRGYLPDADQADWQLSLHPLPPPAREGGLHLRWCRLRLARQPALAGLKHCNRLEQVLARAEWGDTDIDEGLLCDAEGRVISATAANLFVLREGRWSTPALTDSGVAGVCRGWAMEALAATEAPLLPSDVERADAVFLCNAVRGILPVTRLAARCWPPHPMVQAAQHHLAQAHPAFGQITST